MGLLDTIKGLFGNRAKGLADTNNDSKVNLDDATELREQATNALDTNKDGTVNTADLGAVKTALDVNKDGQINATDATALKDKIV